MALDDHGPDPLMLCDFAANDACRFCGRINLSGTPELRANCRRPPCRHAGESLPPVLVQCETCRGRVMIKHQASVCAIVGRCLPMNDAPEGVDGYQPCRSCGRYEKGPAS